jgi:hypothetical protein
VFVVIIFNFFVLGHDINTITIFQDVETLKDVNLQSLEDVKHCLFVSFYGVPTQVIWGTEKGRMDLAKPRVIQTSN